MTLACHRPSSSLVPLPRPVRAGGISFGKRAGGSASGAAQKAFASGTGKTGCPPAGRPSWKTYSGTAAARKRAAEQAAQTAAEARAACEMQAAALLQS